MTNSCAICDEEMKKQKDTLIRCDQCKKDHHASCLEKWFKVSGKCPLCRYQIRDEPLKEIMENESREIHMFVMIRIIL